MCKRTIVDWPDVPAFLPEAIADWFSQAGSIGADLPGIQAMLFKKADESADSAHGILGWMDLLMSFESTSNSGGFRAPVLIGCEIPPAGSAISQPCNVLALCAAREMPPSDSLSGWEKLLGWSKDPAGEPGPTRLFKLPRSSDTRNMEEPADPQRCRAAGGAGRNEGENVGLSQENDVKSG